MISFVRDMWSYGTHLPIYHSDYLFPYTVPPPPPLSLPRSTGRSSLTFEGTPSATTLARMNDSLGINQEHNQEINQEHNQDITQDTGTESGLGREREREGEKENTITIQEYEEKIKKTNLIIQVIRKIFENTVRAYICPLYNWTPEGLKQNHSISWRHGRTVVFVLDIVTDRRKIKVRTYFFSLFYSFNIVYSFKVLITSSI